MKKYGRVEIEFHTLAIDGVAGQLNAQPFNSQGRSCQYAVAMDRRLGGSKSQS
jgi:hypothetical protein